MKLSNNGLSVQRATGFQVRSDNSLNQRVRNTVVKTPSIHTVFKWVIWTQITREDVKVSSDVMIYAYIALSKRPRFRILPVAGLECRDSFILTAKPIHDTQGWTRVSSFFLPCRLFCPACVLSSLILVTFGVARVASKWFGEIYHQNSNIDNNQVWWVDVCL